MTSVVPGGAAAATAIGVSIVLPVKNERAHIRDILGFLDAQTERGFELLLVDNGSTDGTQELLAQEGRRYVSQPGALSDARLAGVRQASGDALLFIDADHVLPRDFIARILEALGTQPYEAFVVPERSYRPAGRLGRILNAERILAEAANRGIPRLYRRASYLRNGGHEANVTFGEDASARNKYGFEQIGTVTTTALEHRELGSLRAIAAKYFSYGRRAGEVRYIAGSARYRWSDFVAAYARLLVLEPLDALGIFGVKLVKTSALLLGVAASKVTR